MPTLSAVDSALSRLLGLMTPTPTEVVSTTAASGRVLAADVVSRWRLPGCDNSSMDGYAVAAADCVTAVVLPVAGESRAGLEPLPLQRGTAMLIATGAPLPPGADAVVPFEEVDAGDGTVALGKPVTAGQYVRSAGADVGAGEVVIPAGRRLRAIDVGACVAVGVVSVEVHRRPRVVILGGGDELVEAGEVPTPYQVPDSNSPMLAAAVEEAGGTVVRIGSMGDDRDAVRAQLEESAPSDLIITSAGVSVGRHDHVRDVVAELGTVEVWRVAMRPGKPVLVGTVRGTPLLGLPGNPVSSAVTFEVFGRPAVLALQGASVVQRRRIPVTLGEDVSTPTELATYLRVVLSPGPEGRPIARLSGDQGSSMVRSLSSADALLEVPAGVGSLKAGATLSAVELA